MSETKEPLFNLGDSVRILSNATGFASEHIGETARLRLKLGRTGYIASLNENEEVLVLDYEIEPVSLSEAR